MEWNAFVLCLYSRTLCCATGAGFSFVLQLDVVGTFVQRRDGKEIECKSPLLVLMMCDADMYYDLGYSFVLQQAP